MTVTAKVAHTSHDGAQTVAISTGHKIQFGHGDGGGDGFCYAHQSFDCIERLTDEEKLVVKNAEEG